MNLKRIFTLFFVVLSTTLMSQQQTKTLASLYAYLYDSEGREIENHFYTYTNGTEEGPDKTYTLYNNDGTKKEQVMINTLNDTSGKYIYVYENDCITITSYGYYGSEIVPESKIVYYGVQDFVETEDLVTSYWFGISMYQCDSFKIFSWNSTTWELNINGVYTYNVNDKPDKLILTVTDMSIDLQITYQYNNNNCTKMFVSVLMMNTPLSLMNIEQTFNASSQLTEIYMYPNINPLLEQFDEEISSYLVEEKIQYTYNTQEDVATVTYLTYNDSTSTFVTSGMSEYVYKLIQVNQEDKYVVDTLYNYIFDYQTNINALTNKALSISIYPNPATESISVQGVETASTVSIFDVKGKQLFSRNITPENTKMYVESLSRGMYIVKIQNKEGVFLSKFLKE